MKTLVIAIFSVTLLATQAGAQQGKRAAIAGIGAMGESLSDMARRQMDLEAEIELAKAKAAIELDLQRKLAADREVKRQRQDSQAATGTPTTTVADESRRQMAILDRSYPAWFEHAESANFRRWMTGQPADVQARFAKVSTAADLMWMINEHRLSLGMEPVKLQR